MRLSGNKVILSCKTGHSIQGQSRLICKGGEEGEEEEEKRRSRGGEVRAIEKKNRTERIE